MRRKSVNVLCVRSASKFAHNYHICADRESVVKVIAGCYAIYQKFNCSKNINGLIDEHAHETVIDLRGTVSSQWSIRNFWFWVWRSQDFCTGDCVRALDSSLAEELLCIGPFEPNGAGQEREKKLMNFGSRTKKVIVVHIVLYRIVPLSKTLSDPEPQCQDHSIV